MHRLRLFALVLGIILITSCTTHDFTAWAVCDSAYDRPPQDHAEVYGYESDDDDYDDCYKAVSGALEEPVLKEPEPDIHARR